MEHIGSSGMVSSSASIRLKRLVTEATNRERVARGLDPLVSHFRLAAIAWEHSRDMCIRRFFSHVNPDLRSPADRVAIRFPEHVGSVGENIFMIDTNQSLSRAPGGIDGVCGFLMKGWMESPGHRKNILSAEFAWIGVGVYATSDDVYATQLFSRPLVVFTKPAASRVRRAERIDIRFEAGPDLRSMTNPRAFIDWPGSRRRFDLGDGRYLVGCQPIALTRAGTQFRLSFVVGDLAGKYSVSIGSTVSKWKIWSFDAC